MSIGAAADIAGAIRAVRERVEQACDRAGRPSGEVTIIAAAKTMPVTAVAAAVEAGIGHIGENRAQEATEKIDAARQLGIEPTWHFIGHLQRNKARQAARYFSVIHSIDSERILREVDRHAAGPLECFIQVNVSGELQKHGVPPREAPGILRAAESCRNARITGLMTIAPRVEHADEARPCFRELRALAGNLGLLNLSMGMTEDFETAIEEGATHVRIGRAIFGERST